MLSYIFYFSSLFRDATNLGTHWEADCTLRVTSTKIQNFVDAWLREDRAEAGAVPGSPHETNIQITAMPGPTHGEEWGSWNETQRWNNMRHEEEKGSSREE